MSKLSAALRSPYAPLYTDDLSTTVGVLQSLQVLLVDRSPATPTLADVSALVSAMQQEFGAAESLEHVIQALSGRHLAKQRIAQRSRLASSATKEVMV